jgi:membrane-bound lytic murein transglycosylase A
MNTISYRSGWLLLLPTVVVLMGACNYTTPTASQAASATPFVELDSLTASAEDLAEMAKLAQPPRKLTSSLMAEGPEALPTINVDPMMLQAMYEHANYLRRPDAKKANLRGLNRLELLETVERLRAKQTLTPEDLASSFDFYRLNTDLHSDQVRMTGYYTPVVKAARAKSGEFQYPLYRRPSEQVPAPASIWDGALAGRGLELAWVSSKRAVENAQLQGSVLVEFPDGKREYFGFGGSVKGAGGSYVFFTKVDNTVLGAGTFPLTAGYSIAIDTRFIPIGATLLAELPDLDPSGKLKGYTYRVLFAQDRGGAIKTTKRIDVYCGMGQDALAEAHKINGHGRLWLMLPKQDGTLVVQ